MFRYDLDLLAYQNESVIFNQIVGQNVSVALQLASGKPRYINGYISRFAQAETDQRYFTAYTAELVPWLWFLTRNSDCRIFQNLSVPDIIAQVFSQFPSAHFQNKLTGTYPTLEYCVQYRETSFNFVCRLMEEYGIFYYFDHSTEGKHTMVLADAPTVFVACPEVSTASYNPGLDEYQDAVTAWHLEQELRTGKYTLTDYNFTTPSTNLTAQAPTVVDLAASKNLELFDFPGSYQTKDQGTALSKLRIEEEEASHLVATGSSACRWLASGYKFTLTDHERSDQNTTYVVTRVEHSASTGAAYSSDTAEAEHYSNRFTCIPATVTYRPPRVSPRPFVQGPQPALVVGKSGEEVWTDKYGRIKVQFYWDRLGKSNENSSCWVRVSSPWAGQNWGSMSIPRVGQEVIVDFLEGDPDRPIVMGRVYNAGQTPPYGLPGSRAISGLKTNSTPGGGGYNEMSMDDTKGKEKVTIHAQFDMSATVEHDDSQVVHNDRTISVDGTHTETIKKDTTITVTDGKQTNTVKQEIVIASQTAYIHVTGSTEIQLEVGSSKLLMKSDGSISLTGANITIDGSESVTIHGASVTSKADADHNIKGAIVVSEGSATNTVKGAMVMLNP